jgi:hypothetical protein
VLYLIDGGGAIARPAINTTPSASSSSQTFQQMLNDAITAEHAPPLTVSGGLDGVIEKFFVAAEQLLQQAQAKLKADTTTQQGTQSQIDSLNQSIDERGPRPGQLLRLNTLNTQLQQENQQITEDKQAINAAKAKVDAAKMVLYADQSQADQNALNSAYNTLTQSGVNIKNGDTLSPDATLTPAQQTAYDTYLKALVQVQADIATSTAAYSELQLFASNPKEYGTIASDAITAVNNVLPNGYYLNGPASIDPNTAQQNSNDANQVAAYWDSVSVYYGAVVNNDSLNNQVTTDQQNLAAYRKSAGYNHAFAYQEALYDPQYVALEAKLQQDEAALTQAGTAVTQAGTAVTNLLTQMLNGLKPELALNVAQSNLSDAEANLAAVQKEPPQLRRLDLADAQQQLALAKQQLYDAQQGQIDITQFTNQDVTTALAQVEANHPYLVSVLPQGSLDSLGGQLEVNQQLNLIQTGQIYLTPDEQALAKTDPVTLAFIKAAGVTIDSSDPTLSPDEQKLAKENPLLFAFMKLGDVHITSGVNNTVTVTVGGTDVTQQALQNSSSTDPAAIMSALMPLILPKVEASGNVTALIAATPDVRLDYVKGQMQLLMGGKNPTDQQAQEAMQLLTENMNGAFSTDERQALWQQAGAPYFNEQYFKNHFNQILNDKSLDKTDRWSSGTAEDKIGEWLQGLLQYASPEAASVILDSIKSGYSVFWNEYVNSGSPSPRGTNFYEALSMAVQLDPSRASEFAQWLTEGQHGGRLLSIAASSNYFPVQNAITDGYGLLSDTIHGQYKNDNSYTAQEFNTTYAYAEKDAVNAQNATYTNNSFNNFNANKDVPAYFNQFKNDPNIGHSVTITSDTQLRDIIGVTLGLTPTNYAAARGGPDGKGDYSVDWYAPGSYQRAVIDLVATWIKQEGGNNPTITALPMIYAGPDAGVVDGALFQVRTSDGKTVFVDGSAAEQAVLTNNQSVSLTNPVYHDVSPGTDIGVQWHFSSISDYQDNNHLSRDGRIYLPQNAILSGGTNGPGYVSYNAHNWTWKDTWNVVTDVGAVTIAVVVTAATGGVGGILLGGAVGFLAFEASNAAENVITLHQGDDVNNNNQQISLLTPLTNNFGHGGVTAGERSQSYIDATTDAVTTFSAAASVAAGGGVTQAVEARTMPAILSKLGVDGLVTAAADATPEDLQAVIEANAKNANLFTKLAIRTGSGAAGNFANQAVMGGGQLVSSGIDVGYQLSQGQITSDQGWNEMGSAFDGFMFNLATAPVAGAAGGVVSNKIIPQLLMNLAVNTVLTEGNEALHGGTKAIENNWVGDTISIGVNTISGAAIHWTGLRNQPKTVNILDPVSGNKVEAVYFKGTEPLVKQFATDGTIDSSHIYDPEKPLQDQSPKFVLVYNPKTEKRLLVPFTADLHAYSPLDRAITQHADKIGKDPGRSGVASRVLAKQEIEGFQTVSQLAYAISQDPQRSDIANWVLAESELSDPALVAQRAYEISQDPLRSDAANWLMAESEINALINQRAADILQDPARSGEANQLLAKQEIEAVVRERAYYISLDNPANSPDANWRQATVEYAAFHLDSPDYYNWPRTGQVSRLHLGEKLYNKLLPAQKPAYNGPDTYSELYARAGAGTPKDYPDPTAGFDVDNHTRRQASLPQLPGAGTDEHYHTYTFNQMKMEFDDWLHKTLRGGGNSVQVVAQALLDKVNSGVKLKPHETVNFVRSVVQMMDPNAEVTLGPVPYYCGGQGHYAAAETQWIRMANLAQLDARTVSDMAALPLAQRAQVHGGMTAIDFFKDPIGYTKQLLRNHPLAFPGTGELTFHKEHVEVQRGEEITVKSPIFQDWLRWLVKNGPKDFHFVIHSDWSRVGEDHEGRPKPVKGAYENFADVVEVFSHPDFRGKITPIFAHTGIGRTARGTDVGLVEVDLKYYNPGNPNPVEEKRTFSDHVELMHFLKEKVPNALFDLSWNDVSQNYADSPDLGKKLINFILKYPDSVFNGSDAVRPVNVHQKNQTQNSMAPLLADLSLQPNGGREAVRMLWTENYSRIKDAAYQGQIKWAQATNASGTPNVDPALFREALDTYTQVQAIRANMRQAQVDGINEWMDTVAALTTAGKLDISTNSPGVFVAHYNSLSGPDPQPEMAPPPGGNRLMRFINSGWAQRGTKTAGGVRNDPASNPDPRTQQAIKQFRIGSAIIGGGALGAEAATYIPGVSHIVTSAIGRTASEVAFPARGALLGVRAIWDENMRLTREQITEEGHVTRESLNEFVSPIFRAAPYKNFTDKQLLDVSAVTEQFWANYQYMTNKPIEAGPGAIWTKEQRAQMIMAQVGEFTSTLARILNVDPGTLSPFEASAPWGKAQRSAILATYLTNIGVSLRSLSPLDLAHPVVLASKLVFLAGNTLGAGMTTTGLAGGFARRGVEGHPLYQRLQAINQWVFTGAGLTWATGDGYQAVLDIVASHPLRTAVDLIGLVTKLGYTYAQYRSALTEQARISGAPMPHSRLSLKTTVILTVALAVAELLDAAENDGVFDAMGHLKADLAGGTDILHAPVQPEEPFFNSIPVTDENGSLDQQIAQALQAARQKLDQVLGDNNGIDTVNHAIARDRRDIARSQTALGVDSGHLSYNQYEEMLAREAVRRGHAGVNLIDVWDQRRIIAQIQVKDDKLAINNAESALNQDLADLAFDTVKRDQDIWK